MSRRACPATIYLCGWADQLILKAGYSASQRWRSFEIRGATTLALAEFEPSTPAFLLEGQLRDVMHFGLKPAFDAGEAAAPFLGGRGSGWKECYKARDTDTYAHAVNVCIAAMRDAMPQALRVAHGVTQMHGRNGQDELTETPTHVSLNPPVSNVGARTAKDMK